MIKRNENDIAVGKPTEKKNHLKKKSIFILNYILGMLTMKMLSGMNQLMMACHHDCTLYDHRQMITLKSMMQCHTHFVIPCG